MPRSARLKSSTGYHHIILKGIMRSNIFENNQDEAFFLNLKKGIKESSLNIWHRGLNKTGDGCSCSVIK